MSNYVDIINYLLSNNSNDTFSIDDIKNTINNYIEKEKYLSCLISADKTTAAIRPIINSAIMHERTATNIYKKYWLLYRQDPPPSLPNVPPVILDEEQKDFQIT